MIKKKKKGHKKGNLKTANRIPKAQMPMIFIWYWRALKKMNKIIFEALFLLSAYQNVRQYGVAGGLS